MSSEAATELESILNQFNVLSDAIRALGKPVAKYSILSFLESLMATANFNDVVTRLAELKTALTTAMANYQATLTAKDAAITSITQERDAKIAQLTALGATPEVLAAVDAGFADILTIINGAAIPTEPGETPVP